jgi:hypothetical protein
LSIGKANAAAKIATMAAAKIDGIIHRRPRLILRKRRSPRGICKASVGRLLMDIPAPLPRVVGSRDRATK